MLQLEVAVDRLAVAEFRVLHRQLTERAARGSTCRVIALKHVSAGCGAGYPKQHVLYSSWGPTTRNSESGIRGTTATYRFLCRVWENMVLAIQTANIRDL